MAWTVLIALALIAPFQSSHARVEEAMTTKAALAEVDADTLMIFDLDNTIVMPAQTMGGEEWFDYLVKKYSAKAKMTTAEAVQAALKRWNRVMEVTAVIPAEPDGPKEIAAKLKIGAVGMALTARPLELAEVTSGHLREIGVDFVSRPVVAKNVDLKTASPSGYRNGVLYAGASNKKSDVLKAFLAATRLKPKKIVFVDNKQKHVDDLDRSLPASIEYLGVRLGVTDAKIAAFEKNVGDLQDVVDIQDHYFSKPMSDREAALLKKFGFPSVVAH